MRDSRELGARFIENPACALAAVDQHLRSTSSLARALSLAYAPATRRLNIFLPKVLTWCNDAPRGVLLTRGSAPAPAGFPPG